MEISRKKLKKAPIPSWKMRCGSEELKLIRTIHAAFNRMFGDSTSLKTSDRKTWGEFLLNRGIVWEINLPSRKFEWDGWDFVNRDNRVVARPKGLEGYRKAGSFYIPHEVATRMLVLEDLM